MPPAYPLRPLVYTALFVALISVGAFIAIPIGPVPIVLQNMFVLLAGLLLGPAWGTACVAVYLLVGLAGLPVFAGGTSSIWDICRLFWPPGSYPELWEKNRAVMSLPWPQAL